MAFSLKEFFLGRPQHMEQVPMFTPEQISTMNQLRGMGMQGMRQNMDFGPIEQQARTGFAQQTLPGIAERFTQMGAQPGSAFQQSLGQAGAGLEETLAAMKSNRQMQMLPMFQNMIGAGLTSPFQNIQRDRQPGYFEWNLSTALQLLPAILGATMGNPAAAASIPGTVSQAATGLGSLFGGGGQTSNFGSPMGGFGSNMPGYNPFTQFSGFGR